MNLRKGSQAFYSQCLNSFLRTKNLLSSILLNPFSKTLVQFPSLVDQKIATIYYIDESLQSATFIYFCSYGSPIRKSASRYFNMVVVVPFLVSLSTTFENTASGMYLGSRFQVCKSTLQLQAQHKALSLTDHLSTTFQSISVT